MVQQKENSALGLSVKEAIEGEGKNSKGRVKRVVLFFLDFTEINYAQSGNKTCTGQLCVEYKYSLQCR